MNFYICIKNIERFIIEHVSLAVKYVCIYLLNLPPSTMIIVYKIANMCKN